MKTNIVSRLVVLALSVTAGPLFATTLSVPPDSPAFTVDIPADWKPKADKADESVEATEPGNHVYMTGWVRTKSDTNEEVAADMEAILKDSMKSVDKKDQQEIIENNGIKFHVLKGSGVDKREGTKVKFFVAMFEAGPGKAGIFYVDYDADAPADVMNTITTIMNSIKLKS
ncbi:MAG TPA: hypothetical protein VE086_00460 [Chthoniobacterales bacterium]|nr:hypothetical protein [Chthoniobacterales bacterium]